MARGDMGYKSTSVGLGTEILNRTKFEGVSVTIDFTSNTSTDAETGEKVVKAGTPIDKDGKAVAATPWTGVVGILLDDVYERRPQGTVIKRGYINTGRAQTNSGKTYDDDLVNVLINAGCNIIFEEPGVVGGLSAGA